MTFGPSSSLERIGVDWIQGTAVDEVVIPDGVRELCDGCFKGCSSLRRVAFGPLSSLERVGPLCFYQCSLFEFEVPVSVRAIGGGAFGECRLKRGIFCRDGCCFRACDGLVLSSDGKRCCCSYGFLSSVRIPDSVSELCDGCFKGCRSLRRVTFGPSSSLERIGVEAFGVVSGGGKPTPCGLVEINIPDGVRELCDGCFKGCRSLRCVTFGPSSSLERIGFSCFEQTAVDVRPVEPKNAACQMHKGSGAKGKRSGGKGKGSQGKGKGPQGKGRGPQSRR